MKLLLHVCCGPDVTIALERLSGYESLCLFFDNPNIHPEEEYRKRTGAFRRVAEHFKVDYVIGNYDPGSWYELIRGHETDPEKGADRQYRNRLAVHPGGKTACQHGKKAAGK